MADDSQGQYHQVSSTDCISSIANQYGFFWRTLWFHPGNADLRSLRKDPNVLRQGDVLFIPPKGDKVEERPTDNKHKFVRKGEPAKFRIRLMKDEVPRSNEPYVLNIDGKSSEGELDGDGMLEIYLPPGAQIGKLVVSQGTPDEQHYELDLGGMDPVTEPKGAIQRLENLGYDCGLDKEKGLPQALRSFQADNHLPDTGELDDATQSKLVTAHGC